MINKKVARVRRAGQTRKKISQLRTERLAVHRTNSHIYAQIFSKGGDKVLVSASTVEKDVKVLIASGANKIAASAVGKRIAEKAAQLGIATVAFDRSGLKYHGRVKALAEAAREGGLKF